MNSLSRYRLYRPAIVLLALFIGLGTVGLAIAQAIYANSDSLEAPVYVPGIAHGTTDDQHHGSAFSQAIYPDDNPPSSGALLPNTSTASFSYYFVSGAALVPRDSTTSYIYDGQGCIHSGVGSIVLNTDLQLPVGSEIKYLRLYFYDTNNPGYVTGYISQYPPSQNSVDLVTVSSPTTGQPGAGFVVSQRITHTVNYENYPYLVIGRPSIANANLRICGLRVAYYAPEFGVNFMPFVKK